MLYRDWLNLKTHLLWCYDRSVHFPVAQNEIFHTDFYANSGAWLVRSGWAQVEYRDNVVARADPGQWLILRPEPRIQSFSCDTSLLSVAFEAIWPDGTHWLSEGLPLVCSATDHPTLERQAKHLVAVMQMRKDAWDTRQQDVDVQRFLELERRLDAWLQTLLKVLDAYGVQPEERYGIDERVTAVVRLLDEYPVGEKLDQKFLATSVGLGVEHMTRLFHQDMHISPRQYFERKRLLVAQELLCQNGVRIKEVAYKLGFRYLPHFSSWFKNATGQTPRQYTKKESVA